MSRAIAILTLVVALVGSQASAASIDPEKEYSAQYGRCLRQGDAAKGVTAAMAACVNTELDRQDARLNTAYKTAMARLSPQARLDLRTAQRAWIKARDRSCQENLTGGTIDVIEVPSCHLNMTAVRSVELERMGRAPR